MKFLLKVTIIIGLIISLNQNIHAQNQEATAQYLQQVSTGMKTAIELTNWQGISITMYSNLNNSLPLAQYWSTSEGYKTEDIPADEKDRFLFRSFTKTLTATIILQLQEEGKVHIDSALSNYIEPVTNVDSTITLRDLLSMRANVCNYIQNSWALIDENPTRIFDTREILELTIPEGSCNQEKEYDYNDTNFQLLGLVIESVTGKAGEDVFQSRFIVEEDSILKPSHPWTFGITPLNIELAPIDIDPHSLNGIWTEDNDVAFDQFGESLNAVLTAQKYSAGVVGRTEDMIRLLAAILTPGQLLSQESIDLMTDFGDNNYGLGLQKLDFSDELEGEDLILYGHMGGGLNASTTFYNPVRKIGFSFAANLTQQNPGTLYNNLSNTSRRNYERLLNCRLENGCVDIITPNPLFGRILDYPNDSSIPFEFKDWDQRIDTVSLLENSFIGSSKMIDSLGQGFDIRSYNNIGINWNLDAGLFSLYQGIDDNLIFDKSEYIDVPNPVFGNLDIVNPHFSVYEIEFFNGNRDTTIISGGCGYFKANSDLLINPNNSQPIESSSGLRAIDSALVSYSGDWEIEDCGRITKTETTTPRYQIKMYSISTFDFSDAIFDVYLPPGYYTDTAKTYPTVYFIHDYASGLDDTEQLTKTMWNLMSSGEAEEMILVKPGNTQETNSFFFPEFITGVLLNNAVPNNFRSNDLACIMGMYDGGVDAMQIGLDNPNEFDCIVTHNTPLDLSKFENKLLPKILEEHGSNPPYIYSEDSGIFSRFASSLVDLKSILFENGTIIPDAYESWLSGSPARKIKSFEGEEELPIAIYFDSDIEDTLLTYEFNQGFSDSLDSVLFSREYFYETYSSLGGETLEDRFEKSLEWISKGFEGGSFGVPAETEERPNEFTLFQNYPNPFNPSTNISFELPEAGLVQLKVYNLLGQEVAKLVDDRMNSGNHLVNFDASQLSSGVYIYRLVAGNQSITKKMMLIK